MYVADRVSNPGSLALESDALPTAFGGPIMLRLSYTHHVYIGEKLCL